LPRTHRWRSPSFSLCRSRAEP